MDITQWRFEGLRIVTVVVFLMLMSSALAADPVTVETVEGTVQYRHDDTRNWQLASAGVTLPIPVEFKTGADAAARVFQSDTSFDISANSHLTLTNEDDDQNGLVTRIKQWLGTVFYDVERQPDTFSVETPFLVATVKGTQFTIVATETSSLVTLSEGKLEVVDLKTGDTRLLNPGDIASVNGEQAGIDFLQQAPDALTAEEQQLALDIASVDTDLDLENYAADTVVDLLGDDLHASLALNLDTGLGGSVGAVVGADLGDALSVNVGADVGDDLGVDIGADLGDELGVDIGADLGDELGVDIGADLGDELGVDIGADLGDELGADIGADLGDGIGVDVGLDIGSDIGADIDLDLGSDIGVDSGIDLGLGGLGEPLGL